jgi:hypothetical protein
MRTSRRTERQTWGGVTVVFRNCLQKCQQRPNHRCVHLIHCYRLRRMCSGFLQWPKVISSESNSVSNPYWRICKYWYPCAWVIPEGIQYQPYKQPWQGHNFAVHWLIGSTWMTFIGEILINTESKAAEIQRFKIKAVFFRDMTPWILVNS